VSHARFAIVNALEATTGGDWSLRGGRLTTRWGLTSELSPARRDDAGSDTGVLVQALATGKRSTGETVSCFNMTGRPQTTQQAVEGKRVATEAAKARAEKMAAEERKRNSR
jgi:hypothetical protein